MNKKFLDKVTEQIISETRIDYNELSPTLYTPFFFPPLLTSLINILTPPRFLFSYFTKHCVEVDGLNDDEVGYVLDRYRYIIKNKIENE